MKYTRTSESIFNSRESTGLDDGRHDETIGASN